MEISHELLPLFTDRELSNDYLNKNKYDDSNTLTTGARKLTFFDPVY